MLPCMETIDAQVHLASGDYFEGDRTDVDEN